MTTVIPTPGQRYVLQNNASGTIQLSVGEWPKHNSIAIWSNVLVKPVKRFQMKSNGCRDVQHTGLQSTQTRRNTGKQGAQTRGTLSQASLHQWLHLQFKVTKTLKNFGCISIQGY